MSSCVRRTGYSILFASLAAVGLSSTAYSFTLTDDTSVTGTLGNAIYYGAENTYNNADIIGSSPPFSIISAVVSRSGVGNNTLNIRINTNYAGAPGTGPADGTQYGSLFLSPGFWSPTGTAATHYATDNFYDDPSRWSYAVGNPASGAVGYTTSTSTGLYAIGGVSSPSYGVHSASIPVSYTSTNGVVVMSNVNGDPVTYPQPGHPGFYFREGQAVQYNPTNLLGTVSGTSVTFTVGNGYLDYTILDNGLFGDNFALSWAMTCANDVIQGQISLASGDLTGTPLPGALPMFSAGLGMLGLMGWRRKRKKAAGAIAA